MSNMRNNQARGHWVPQEPVLAKKYQETDFARKKSGDKQQRRDLIEKALASPNPPTPTQLARRFMVSVPTIKADIRAIGKKL